MHRGLLSEQERASHTPEDYNFGSTAFVPRASRLLLCELRSLHSVSVGAKPLSTGQCAPCRRLFISQDAIFYEITKKTHTYALRSALDMCLSFNSALAEYRIEGGMFQCSYDNEITSFHKTTGTSRITGNKKHLLTLRRHHRNRYASYYSVRC